MADTLAIGHLERLWHLTMRDAPRGDIGKLDDVEIADECGWESEPELLISILVENGWLDESDEHRLIVHDWHEHCPGLVKRNIERRGGFVTTQVRRLATPNHSREAFGDDTKPNQTKPIDRSIGDRPTDEHESDANGPITVGEWAVIEPEVIEHSRKLHGRNNRREIGPKDWGLVAQCLAIERRHGVNILDRVHEAVRAGRANKPFAYLKTAVLNECATLGLDGHKVLKSLACPFRPQPREAVAQPP